MNRARPLLGLLPLLAITSALGNVAPAQAGTDGRDIEWMAIDDADAFDDNGFVIDLAVGPAGGAVIVGGASTLEDAHVWHTSDGVAWEAVRLPGGRSALALGVTETPDGFIAVGTSQGRRPAGYVWTSRDGADWSEPSKIKGASLSGVTSIADRTYIAGDLVNRKGDRRTPTVWSSTDTASWVDVSLDRPGNTQLLEIAGNPGGPTLALGARLGRDVSFRLWRSEDGTTWTEVGLPAQVDDEGLSSAGLAASPAGLLLSTTLAPANGRSVDGQLWTSPDGAAWTTLPGPPGVYTTPGTGAGGRVVQVVVHPADGRDDPTAATTVMVTSDGTRWCAWPGPTGEGISVHDSTIMPDGGVLIVGRRLDESLSGVVLRPLVALGIPSAGQPWVCEQEVTEATTWDTPPSDASGQDTVDTSDLSPPDAECPSAPDSSSAVEIVECVPAVTVAELLEVPDRAPSASEIIALYEPVDQYSMEVQRVGECRRDGCDFTTVREFEWPEYSEVGQAARLCALGSWGETKAEAVIDRQRGCLSAIGAEWTRYLIEHPDPAATEHVESARALVAYAMRELPESGFRWLERTLRQTLPRTTADVDDAEASKRSKPRRQPADVYASPSRRVTGLQLLTAVRDAEAAKPDYAAIDHENATYDGLFGFNIAEMPRARTHVASLPGMCLHETLERADRLKGDLTWLGSIPARDKFHACVEVAGFLWGRYCATGDPSFYEAVVAVWRYMDLAESFGRREFRFAEQARPRC